MLIRFFTMAAAAVAFASAASAQMPTTLRDKSNVPAFLKDKGAQVLDVSPGPGGLTAYTAVKNGNTIIVYTTPDRSVSIVGALFDSKTGANLSEAILERSNAIVAKVSPPAAGQAGAEAAQPARPTLSGANARMPIAQHLFSDEVAGVKEGNGSAVNTTYVFFDPRCGYCHNLYQNTRQVVAKGASIKWIPVNTLGAPGVPISAEVLRNGAPALGAMASNKLRGVEPSAMERERIQVNTRFFGDIVAQVGKQAGTPTIVFQGANGKFTVVQDDGSDKAAFSAAFRVAK